MAEELKQLKISVDVLGPLEIVEKLSELDPVKFGIVVSTSDGRSGVLLPNLPGVNKAEEQIKICLSKGSIGSSEKIMIQRFESTRFE